MTKKKKVSGKQRTLLDFFNTEKEPGTREVMVESNSTQWDGKDYEYARSSGMAPFPLSRRNNNILEALEGSPKRITELASILKIREKTVAVELEFLRYYNLVRKVD